MIGAVGQRHRHIHGQPFRVARGLVLEQVAGFCARAFDLAAAYRLPAIQAAGDQVGVRQMAGGLPQPRQGFVGTHDVLGEPLHGDHARRRGRHQGQRAGEPGRGDEPGLPVGAEGLAVQGNDPLTTRLVVKQYSTKLK